MTLLLLSALHAKTLAPPVIFQSLLAPLPARNAVAGDPWDYLWRSEQTPTAAQAQALQDWIAGRQEGARRQRETQVLLQQGLLEPAVLEVLQLEGERVRVSLSGKRWTFEGAPSPELLKELNTLVYTRGMDTAGMQAGSEEWEVLVLVDGGVSMATTSALLGALAAANMQRADFVVRDPDPRALSFQAWTDAEQVVVTQGQPLRVPASAAGCTSLWVSPQSDWASAAALLDQVQGQRVWLGLSEQAIPQQAGSTAAPELPSFALDLSQPFAVHRVQLGAQLLGSATAPTHACMGPRTSDLDFAPAP